MARSLLMVVAAALVAVACDGGNRAPSVPVARAAPPPRPERTATAPEPTRAGFLPPSASRRRAAIGDVSSLARTLRSAFAPSAQFDPISMPSAGDWLAEHKEDGQTFDDYVASAPNKPDDDRGVIYIVPVGPLSAPGNPSVATLTDYVSRFYQLPVKALPAIAVGRVSTYRRINAGTGKPQLLAGEIMRLLKQRLPQDAYCLIAVTATDLYPRASWNFVFGQASLSERVGVFSFARYHPSFFGGKPHTDAASQRRVLLRSLKVMVHEIGHMFGMHHCTHYSCVMDGSNSMAESDRKPAHLCPVGLHKLYFAHRFDPKKRYRQLAAFYHRVGLARQAAWAQERATALP